MFRQKRTILINGIVVEKQMMIRKKIKVRKTDDKKIPNFPKNRTLNLKLLEKLINTPQDSRLDVVQPATEPGTMSNIVFRVGGPFQTDHSAVQHTTKIMGKSVRRCW